MNEFDIFVEAAEKAPEEAERFLAEVCADQPDVRHRVRALLSAHRAPGFLDVLSQKSAPSEKPRIAGYKLLEPIGEGAFADVYMADQLTPVRRRIAVKVLKLGMDTKQVVARFNIEQQAMAMMDHPSIARVHEAGSTDQGRPYFSMELVPGEPIVSFCDHQQTTVRERLKLVIAVCRAIQHAHQKGIIHRDIKPTNVLVTLEDNVAIPKVIDFGVAKATDSPLNDATAFTQFRQLVGTPAYMSPEQAELNTGNVDTRTDIYSIGVLLYELLTGQRPFESSDLPHDETLRRIREVEAPSLPASFKSLSQSKQNEIAANRRVTVSDLLRMTTGELDWIVGKALAKDRTQRYDTASAFADDIERYLNDLPVVAGPPSIAYRIGKFVDRNRLFVASTAAVFLALVTGLGFAISGQHAARKDREKAERETDRAKLAFELLRDLIVVVDPADGRGPDYTMKEALDEFAPTLNDRFDRSMPEVKAEIYGVVGSTYDNLGLPYDAEQYLRQSFETRESAVPHDDVKLAQSYFDFARNAIKRCDAPAACRAGKLALDALRRANVPPDPGLTELYERANDICDVSRIMQTQKREFQHQKVVYETVIPVFTKIEREHPERLMGMFMTSCIFLLLDVGEYELAERLCTSAQGALDPRLSDNERTNFANVSSFLAIIYRQHGMRDQAQAIYPSLRTDANGDADWFRNNPWQMMILADALLHDEASTVDDHRTALHLSRRFFPIGMLAHTPEIRAMAALTLATALASNELPDDATQVLRRSLDNIPSQSLFVRGALEYKLAELLEQQGTAEEAEEVLRNAIQWRRECLDDEPDHVQTALAERNLALFLMRNLPDASVQEVRSLLETARHRVRSSPPGNYYRDTIGAALQELTSGESQ